MENRTENQRSVAIILSVLTFLFTGRVLAQLVQSQWDLPALPAIEIWTSGTLSYAWLLMAQIALILLMVSAVRLVLAGRIYTTLGMLLCAIGVLYAGVMAFRAIVGFLELSAIAWFAYPLPTAFHFVLAGFVLILGWHWATPRPVKAPDNTSAMHGWRRIPTRLAPVLGYPAVILFGLCLFNWLVRDNIGQAFAAYLAVTLSATAVLAHEMLNPYRTIWRPSGKTIIWDITYLVAVQVMLPAVLSLVIVSGISFLTDLAGFNPVGFWPHEWPLAAQVVIMMLIADFLRYWLHRASHRIRWLWALHAVHHAPKELYFLNVGRFHPGDKALQFLFDALPFVLMGVSTDVLASYFVFYAINGFFQHSNANLRLGFLNWIISGPELHRWHHAKAYELANFNFGNNLIIWDAVFGTRYLPANDHVGEIGIGNEDYPEDFLGQTMAPFLSSPDADPDR